MGIRPVLLFASGKGEGGAKAPSISRHEPVEPYELHPAWIGISHINPLIMKPIKVGISP